MAENLVESLRSAGIRVPEEVSSVGNLETSVLISICAQSLSLISNGPTVMASGDERDFCTEMASAIKKVGYISEITFHQFLYPSEEESSKIIRFLLEKISESSETRRNRNIKGFGDQKIERIVTSLDDKNVVDDKVLPRIDEPKLSDLNLKCEASGSREFKRNKEDSSEEASTEERLLSSLRDRASKTRHESEKSDLRALEDDLGLLEAAVEFAFDDQQSVKFHVENLSTKVAAKRQSLQELNSQWEGTRKSLESEKETLRRSLYANEPETREKFESLKRIELQTQKVLEEVKNRKEELCKVSKELERQPKGASRKSHIDRVNEITKNSEKQNADIERILRETRELQIESNGVQECLHRTYTIVDEMVFREAKKDSVGRQAYRLLTSFHESFEQIAEKIMATDRVRREVAEREKKLSEISSQCPNTDKFQNS